jgi:hypothetical protein
MSSLWAWAARVMRESTRSGAQPALARARLVSATTWASRPDAGAAIRGRADGDGVAEARGVADGVRVGVGVALGVRLGRAGGVVRATTGRSATSAVGALGRCEVSAAIPMPPPNAAMPASAMRTAAPRRPRLITER